MRGVALPCKRPRALVPLAVVGLMLVLAMTGCSSAKAKHDSTASLVDDEDAVESCLALADEQPVMASTSISPTTASGTSARGLLQGRATPRIEADPPPAARRSRRCPHGFG